MNLSYRQLEVFQLLMQYDINWKPALDTDLKDITSTSVRKLIMKETKINKNNLSKYLAEFKSKGLIVKNQFDKEEINRLLMPDLSTDILSLKFDIKCLQ